MTQVDFYILGTNTDDSRLRLACRISEKALQNELKVFVHTGNESDANKLDEMLWTFSQGSFIPHRVIDPAADEAYDEPVLIGRGDLEFPAANGKRVDPRWDVMINLSLQVPDFFSRYDRVAEVVDAEPQRRESGRERFRFYRDRGYALKTHNV